MNYKIFSIQETQVREDLELREDKATGVKEHCEVRKDIQ